MLEPVIDERLEQFERHLLGQAALVEPQVRTGGDDGSSGIVDALAQQILAEAALLSLQRVAQGFEGALVGAGDHPAVSSVIEQDIHRLLKHPLFVPHDDVGRIEIHQALEPVVPVDDAPVEVVEIRGGEPSALERHKGPEVGRQHRDDIHDHLLGLEARLAEGIHDLEPLGQFLPLRHRRGGVDILPQLPVQLLQIEALEQDLDGLGADAGIELVAVELARLAVFLLGQQLPAGQARLFGVDDDIAVEVEDLLHVFEGQVEQIADLARQAL